MRARHDIERDVLAAALLQDPFRSRLFALDAEPSWTHPDHRELAAAIRSHPGTITEPDLLISRTLGWTLDEAQAWLLGSVPTYCDLDLADLQREDRA